MYSYNVFIKINAETEIEWLKWMRKIHIKEVMDTGCFSFFRISKTIFPENKNETEFVIQYGFSDMKKYEKYSAEFAPALQKAHTDKFIGKFTASRSITVEV